VRRFLIVGFCTVGLGTFGISTTYAQEAQVPAAEGDSVEEVTVTGTRIVRPEFAAPTPLTSLSAAQLATANPGGPVDALRQLPVLAFSSGPRGATGSAGQGGSFLNLRNLGANRTLVLLDGKRFVPTSGGGTVDISLFPTALIDRTEIVTGGASAAYGSDAVTGVVNFILDRNFTGFKASAQGGVSTFADDKESQFSMTFGSRFGGNRGHFLLSGEHYKSAGVYSLLDRPQGRRSCAAITNPGGATARTFACDVRSSQANFTGVITAPSAFKGTFDDAGNPIPFHTGSLVSSTTMVGGDGIRPQFLPLAVPIDRDVVFARTSWAFTDNLTGYLEGNYGKSNYEYQIGSYDQNLGATALSIAHDNAFLPASLRAQLEAAKTPQGKFPTLTLNKYFADLPRTWIQNLNDTTRAVAGLEGRLALWNWDFHYEHGENRNRTIATFDENLNNMTLAADAVLDPASGQIVCRSSQTNPGNGCIPFNVMGNAGIAAPADGTGANTVTEAQLNYLTGTDWLHSHVKQDNAAVNFNGEPFSIWAGPVSIATGFEWRKESIVQTVAPSGLEINTASQVPGPFRVGNYQPQSGSLSVKEGYVETVAPLVHNLPLVKSLDFNGAVRVTDYSTSGNAVTWKAGLSWSITDEVRVRATRSRDERAPNLTELYSGAVAAHNSIIDYPRGPTFVNSQTVIYTSGNPNLKPEKGDTTTAGIVYQPHWGPDWQTSLDWYHIAISDAIVSVGAQEIVRQCSLGNAADCGLILRDSSGGLFGVNNSPLNVQSLLTTGVDVETRYRFALRNLSSSLPGEITLRGLLNYVSRFETATLGVTTINQAGQLTHPTTRFTAQLTYDARPWSFFIQARYSGWGYYDKTTAATDLPQRKIGGQTPIDVNLAYDLPIEKGETSIYLNVTDVFNVLPPPFSDGPGSTGQNYDPIGRFYRLGVRLRF
jgi:iron complex outermembrane receptor protein